ncbi:PREDICTED: U2 small nuclear ribonucleoprotein auxiliary factor 35 kDa subunit-related protein 2-like [Trachymyrmex cornetzi]|uniref:U2 small nuclear ribonucleoprotein auxiliary factor 35 kDa subunit-related protein 2 n=1 Tax=Trachymyrmex cornetzi TaxID=471704 RepID=A0A195EGC7_9HYME|nr:PREDICTED: U2 small nuclear ribonucleoprotein auxiliary factor 35 kDa subunit-related protein 2-like [Trachymyrmex cornetzi]KYN26957.1 U2 small nuclear ribonucleoprotein auxiliary factor 35 kDa subunit-related protein 2 [Trachymyrmex cornetzi]
MEECPSTNLIHKERRLIAMEKLYKRMRRFLTELDWLKEEIKKQKKWQLLQKQRKITISSRSRKKYKKREKKNSKKKTKRESLIEEIKKKYEEQPHKSKQLQKDINDYIDGVKTPEGLRRVVDSRSTKKLCPSFELTGVCRHKHKCSKNHRKIFLSNVILITGLYFNFSVEKNPTESNTDVAIEFQNSGTWHYFCKFHDKIITKLKSFGEIKTLKCCWKNKKHWRANLYIQYDTKRAAAKAWKNLKGRCYNDKPLVCKFVNVKSLRSVVCSLTNCPKSNEKCNYLHTSKIPHNKYIKNFQQKKSNLIDDKLNKHRFVLLYLRYIHIKSYI